MNECELNDITRDFKVEFLIATATPTELNAALETLSPIEEEILKVFHGSNTFYIGLLGSYISAVVKTNTMGAISTGGSLQTIQESLEAINPKAVIMVGLALGANQKKQNIGDILVSHSLTFYEQARLNEDGDFIPRGIKPESNRTLFNRLSQDASFSYSFNSQDKEVSVVTGSILSGEKLIDDPKFKKKLFEKFPDAIGGEMEMHGVYVACHEKNTPWIMIKSICDWADGTKNKEYQEMCAYGAFSFLKHNLNLNTAFSDLGINVYKPKTDLQEVSIEAEDILSLIVSRKDYEKVIRNKEVKKFSSKKVYFEYFKYEDRGRTEGFLFLGRNITVTNTLSYFKDNFDLPDILNVYITKKYNNGLLIDRKNHLIKEISKNKLNSIVYEGVKYLEDVIWESTLKNYDSSNNHVRSDYIDQSLYSFDDINQELGKCEDFFRKTLSASSDSQISLIFGSGGVGKTTFSDVLIKLIDEVSDQVGVFTIRGERTRYLKNFSDLYIDNLPDLFDAFKSDSNLAHLSKEDFALNYSCGNIRVIVDGLDEVDSALGEKFHLGNFFKSLNELDKRFNNTKILLTARDYLAKEVTESHRIKKYKLHGFTIDDIEKFKSIKLANDSQKNQFDKLIRKNTNKNFSLPVIINLACEAVKTNNSSHKYDNSSSKYFINSMTYDYILNYLLDREIDKHKINANVDDMFELLIEMVVEHKNKMAIPELKEYVELNFDEKVERFLKNPLFHISEECVAISEEALISLVKSRYIKVLLTMSKPPVDKLAELLKEAHKGTGELFTSIVETLEIDNHKENLADILNSLRKKEKSTESKLDKSKYRRAISSLIHLLTQSWDCNTKAERTNFFLDLKCFGNNRTSLNGIHIIGDFPPIDLSKVNVMHSSFNEFPKFEQCIFRDDDTPTFSYCHFENIQVSSALNLKSNAFEKSCTFEKSNIHNQLECKSDLQKNKRITINDNIKSIARYIDTYKRSYNLIKLNTTVKWSKSHKGFIKELVKNEFLIQGDAGLYSITNEYYDYLPDIKLGRFPEKLERIVGELI